MLVNKKRDEMKTLWCAGYTVIINLAGNYDDAVRICKSYCNKVGLCVTIERCNYIYTGGCEDGVKVTLINYPKFPSEGQKIYDTGIKLAHKLRKGLYQDSVLISDGTTTGLISNRIEK